MSNNIQPKILKSLQEFFLLFFFDVDLEILFATSDVLSGSNRVVLGSIELKILPKIGEISFCFITKNIEMVSPNVNDRPSSLVGYKPPLCYREEMSFITIYIQRTREI